MPPRKRTQSASKTEAEQETAEQVADNPADNEAPVAEEAPAPAAETKPKRSRHAAEEPCTQCFPGGWPDDSTGLGCEHGSWTRD